MKFDHYSSNYKQSLLFKVFIVYMNYLSVFHLNKTLNFSGDNTWIQGQNGGILMTCRDVWSHDTHVVTSRIWALERNRSSPTTVTSSAFPGTMGTRELSHGFLNLTFTRALRKNVKKRLQKLNVEIPTGDTSGSGDALGKFYFHKYVSEVCISMAPCDFMLCLEPVSAVIKNLPLLAGKHPRQSSGTTDKHTVENELESEALLTSSNVPLLYADIGCIRVFIPGQEKVVARKEKKFRTTLDHDMFLLQVKSDIS